VVEIAALGKPLEIHNTDEMGGYNPPPLTREIAMGDRKTGGPDDAPAPPPTLRKPGEAAPAGGPGKVQFPTTSQPSTSSTNAPPMNSSSAPHLQ